MVKKSPKQQPPRPLFMPASALCFPPEAMPGANVHSSCLPAMDPSRGQPPMSLSFSLRPPPGCGFIGWLGSSGKNSTAWWAGGIAGESLLPPCRLTASGLQVALAKCTSRGICGTWQCCLETWLEQFLSFLTYFFY